MLVIMPIDWCVISGFARSISTLIFCKTMDVKIRELLVKMAAMYAPNSDKGIANTFCVRVWQWFSVWKTSIIKQSNRKLAPEHDLPITTFKRS